MFLQNPRNELPDHYLAFANPTRLRILERLAAVGEVNVNDLALFLHMSQPRISWPDAPRRAPGLLLARRGEHPALSGAPGRDARHHIKSQSS